MSRRKEIESALLHHATENSRAEWTAALIATGIHARQVTIPRVPIYLGSAFIDSITLGTVVETFMLEDLSQDNIRA